jgi:Domain of unknown function DUF29
MHESLYETDFYQWTQTQAAALRHKDLAALDLDHLAEEIESLGASDRRAIRSHLTVLTQHLLKLVYQPQERGTRGAGWRISIRNARRQIELILNDSPSLRGFLPEAIDWAYRHGRVDAADETGLPLTIFPETCPWPMEQVLDEDFWPEEVQ